MEERSNLKSILEQVQSTSNLPSASSQRCQHFTPDDAESTSTETEENDNEIPETMNSQARHAYFIQLLQNTCTNIHVIIPKAWMFQKVEKILLFLNSAWRIRILGKPLFSISIRYLYFESLLHPLFSDLNNYFVHQICNSCFGNTVALETADYVIYFAMPELPLKRIIERIIDQLRVDQLFVVALVQHKIGGNQEETDCLLDLMWSLYGRYGDEIRIVTSHVHFCFIHHGSQAIFDLENMLHWGCVKVCFNKSQLI